MRTTLRYLIPLIGAAGAAAMFLAAPIASAQPEPPLPTCTNVGGDVVSGGSTTECATPGNVQINATPPVVQPVYPSPWDDEFYGAALIFGGGGHGGGGGHR